MGGVGRTVFVDGVVGVAVVSDDDGFVARGVGGGHHLVDALVHSLHGLFDGSVHTRVSHHVAVGEVYNDEVVFVLLDGRHELVLHFVGRHFRLEVVSGHFGRSHENAVFTFVGRFASAVEEERHVGILFRFGCVELLQPLGREVLAERVFHVLLWEEDVNAGERSIVGGHAVVLQAGDGVHTLFGHILLREHHGELLGAVVAVVEEDDHVAFLDASVHVGVHQRFHELISVLVVFRVRVVAALHAFHHVADLSSLALHELVVGNFHAVPAFVTVHGVEASDDGSDVGTVLVAHFLEVGHEALAALRVGVASVHEAVDIGAFGHAVFLGNLNQLEEVVERAVNATGRGQPHEV